MRRTNVPETSFMNLFAEIIYDADQIPEFSLDIWNAYRVDVIPKTLTEKAVWRYRVEQQDSLASIAQKFYGNDRLWWLTLLINDVEDPFGFLENKKGSRGEDGVIKVLKQEHINTILIEISRIKEQNNRRNKEEDKNINIFKVGNRN